MFPKYRYHLCVFVVILALFLIFFLRTSFSFHNFLISLELIEIFLLLYIGVILLLLSCKNKFLLLDLFGRILILQFHLLLLPLNQRFNKFIFLGFHVKALHCQIDFSRNVLAHLIHRHIFFSHCV